MRLLTILGVHHAAFQVADLERSLRFYRDTIGFEVVWQRVNKDEYVRTIVGYPDADLHQAMLRFPGTDVCLELIDYRGVQRTPVDTRPPNPGTAHICLLVDNLREEYERLRAAGAGARSEPVAVTSGANKGRLAVYLVDPDGFPVELVSSGPEALA